MWQFWREVAQVCWRGFWKRPPEFYSLDFCKCVKMILFVQRCIPRINDRGSRSANAARCFCSGLLPGPDTESRTDIKIVCVSHTRSDGSIPLSPLHKGWRGGSGCSCKHQRQNRLKGGFVQYICKFGWDVWSHRRRAAMSLTRRHSADFVCRAL